MNCRTVAYAAIVALAACSDSSGPPEGRVPELGSYSYSMAIPNRPGLIGARTYTGTLTITFATEDSIAGVWAVPVGVREVGSDVPGYQDQLKLGFWNNGAYVADADVRQTGLMVHRLTPREGGFNCDGGLLIFGSSGSPLDFTRVDGVCTVQLRAGQ